MKIHFYMKRLTVALLIILPGLMIAQEGAESMKGTRNQIVLEHKVSPDNRTPMELRGDSVWLHYDDIENFDAWGFLISGEEYDIVSKWDAADITNYEEWVITKIKFIVVNDQPFIKVKVWEGSDYTEIYSQDVPEYEVNDWTEVVLDTPVDFDATKELYVGYYVDMTHTELGGFVTATDDGPPVDDYGNLCRWNGSWYSDFNNHNLRVLIEPNLNADFEADNTVICVGSSVNFTNLSTAEETYSWTFEGGTPATSTDENPTVTYNTPGTYDVTLEVYLNDDSDTETKENYITVLDLPDQTDTPDGESGVCTNQYYDFTTSPVLYAQDYEWEITPPTAGTLTVNDTLATLEVASDWTGDFTLRVRATNICGDGDWSDELEGTVYQSPEVFSLEGGGGYCAGTDGVELTLNGSETDTEYELFLGGETTGIVLEGTGSEISFGLVTDEGYYQAFASNANCDIAMMNQVQVWIDFVPLEPGTPEGPEVVCEETSSDYTSEGTDDADSYVWLLSPEAAGTLTANGLDATVEWDPEFFGVAAISLYGINECGDGNLSNELEVSVGTPAPVIAGQDLVCDWSEEFYEVEEHDGSTYTWEVTGGEIIEGQGTHMVTISWQGEGSGTVNVEEFTEGGCAGTAEEIEVMIDDCTGLSEMAEKSMVTVSPNPVTGSVLNITSDKNEENYRIKILDSSGQTLIDKFIRQGKNTIDVSVLPQGLYLLLVEDSGSNRQALKIVKY
jgi:PKD repeat protein